MKKSFVWEFGTIAAIGVVLRHAEKGRRFPPRGGRNLDNSFFLAELTNDHVRSVLDSRAALLDEKGNRIRTIGTRASAIEAACKLTWNGSSTNGAAVRLERVRKSLSGRDGEDMLSQDAVTFLTNLCIVLKAVGKIEVEVSASQK
jgi:hypothetical protein